MFLSCHPTVPKNGPLLFWACDRKQTYIFFSRHIKGIDISHQQIFFFRFHIISFLPLYTIKINIHIVISVVKANGSNVRPLYSGHCLAEHPTKGIRFQRRCAKCLVKQSGLLKRLETPISTHTSLKYDNRAFSGISWLVQVRSVGVLVKKNFDDVAKYIFLTLSF